LLAAIGALKPAASASMTAAVARHALASFDIVRMPATLGQRRTNVGPP
jgi:hypothetical protein